MATASSFVRAETRAAFPTRPRTMREFAEQEIVLPDGPHKGLRYRTSRQPYAALWFAAVDSGRWRRHFALGPTQSGKTLTCFIVPVLYHLFEARETVIAAVPMGDMVKDKWMVDLRPAIEASRYRKYLPRSWPAPGAPPPDALSKNGLIRFKSLWLNTPKQRALSAAPGPRASFPVRGW